MKHSTSCKYCGIPISVSIDPEYDIDWDPLKIMPFASCNRCADLRVRFKKITTTIEKLCLMLALNKPSKDDIELIESSLRKLLERYLGLMSDWYRKPGMIMDESMLESLTKNPIKYRIILKDLWNHYLKTIKSNHTK